MKNAETNKKRWNKFVYDYNGQKQIVWDNLTKRKRNPTMAENSSSWGRGVVKWSACSSSTPTIRVQIPLKPTNFSVKLCLKRTKINKKRPWLAHLKTNFKFAHNVIFAKVIALTYTFKWMKLTCRTYKSKTCKMNGLQGWCRQLLQAWIFQPIVLVGWGWLPTVRVPR